MTTTRTLNDIMEIDHVIRVHDDGSITDVADVWAPELVDSELVPTQLGHAWEFFAHGYSGQDSYSGPVMHDSEFIAGQLERDIRATSGVYVAVAGYYTNESDTDHKIITSRITGEAHCESCGFGGCDDEPTMEGWAVARLVENVK